MNENVAVIIPVYDEGPVIRGVVRSVEKYFSKIICVNDSSKDNSVKEISKTKAQIVNHPINLGAGAATQTGVEFALQDPSIEYFVTFDGDGQHKIEDVAGMLEYLKINKLDVVFGSRFLGQVENVGKTKKFFLRIVKSFNALTTSIPLSDPHIGLRIFSRKFAEDLDITLSGFAHASEIVHQIKAGNYAYGEFPVTVLYTDYSKKKGQPMINSVNIVFDLLFHKVSKK